MDATHNYAFKLRNHGAHAGSGPGYVFGQPRPKFAYFMLFELSEEAKPSWHDDAVRTGSHVASMKSFSHPGYDIETQELRAYNAIRHIPIKVKYKPITARFWDESTAYVARLMKEYRKWYHYGGHATSPDDFGNKVGPSARGGKLPSIGLREKKERQFFTSIKIYDLGTNPGAVNFYKLVNPIITSVDQTELDYGSTDHVEYTFTIQHEGYIDEIAQPLTKYPEVFTGLGIDQGVTGDTQQHGTVGFPLEGLDQDNQTGNLIDSLLGGGLGDVVDEISSLFNQAKTATTAGILPAFSAVRSAVQEIQRVIDNDRFSVSDVIGAGTRLISTVEQVAPMAFSAGRTVERAVSSATAAASSALFSTENLKVDNVDIEDLIGG